MNKVNVCFVGIGLAGFSIFIELLFDERFIIHSIIDSDLNRLKSVKTYSDRIELDTVLNYDPIKHKKIDLFIFSIPPISLNSYSFLFKNSDHLIIINKPGIKLLSKNVSLYYSRHQYNYYKEIQKLLQESYGSVHVVVKCNFSKIYNKGKTYLTKSKNGIVRDSLPHYLEMFSDLLPTMKVIGIDCTQFSYSRAEIECYIELKYNLGNIVIEFINDENSDSNKWSFIVGNNEISVDDKYYYVENEKFSIKIEETVGDNIIKLYCNEKNFFVNSSVNNLILQIVDDLEQK